MLWKTVLLFSLPFWAFASFDDAEFESVLSKMKDLKRPTLQDYERIEQYLVHGKRPYFDFLLHSESYAIYRGRMKSIANFRLVGPTYEEPIFEHHVFHSPDRRRCILLYASSNGSYPAKARKLLGEIKDSGFRGHVLLRIGGFPNVENGGLKISDVPYSFKVAFLQEAKWLGFDEALWIDLAIHPLGDFEMPFSEIKKNGYFFTMVGILAENSLSHLPQAAVALEITPELYGQIPHISSSMIGMDMNHPKAAVLLERWYAATEKGFPSLTWWPEELSLSVTAWRLGCPPAAPFGEMICMESEQFQLEQRPRVAFYLDARRDE
jgi:hypothetical protein